MIFISSQIICKIKNLMGKLAETKKDAIKIKKELLTNSKIEKNINIYKFSTKRKYQFFIGTWWEWLTKIS